MSGKHIETDAGAAFARLVPALVRSAERIARNHLAERSLARRDDPRRWRRATLIWPSFTRG